MVAELFHVGAPVRSIGSNLKNLVYIRIYPLLEKINDFPHRSAVDIQHCNVIGAEEELTISFGAHLFKQGQSLVFVLIDLLDVLAATEDDSEHVGKKFAKLIHSKSQLCGLDWITRE